MGNKQQTDGTPTLKRSAVCGCVFSDCGRACIGDEMYCDHHQHTFISRLSGGMCFYCESKVIKNGYCTTHIHLGKKESIDKPTMDIIDMLGHLLRDSPSGGPQESQ
jgi:hypothetical protein